ncbi:hypothetical protein ACYOEI_30570, partial [Singulisphaera rosea]
GAGAAPDDAEGLWLSSLGLAIPVVPLPLAESARSPVIARTTETFRTPGFPRRGRVGPSGRTTDETWRGSRRP